MPSDPSAPFGELLRRARQAAGLTQAELAERAGLSWRGINDLERGARLTPRKDTVALLAQALLLTDQERRAFEAAARHSKEQSAQATATTTPPAPIQSETPVSSLPTGTLDAHPHNLPLQTTPLIGREREVAAVCALVQREDVRLVTLTGTGGTGKTRLALQVAAELVEAFADGVWFVSLSRLSDPKLVLPTIARTLGLREVGSQTIAELLRAHLRARRLLLVLDNFEQVMAAAPAVAELLVNSPGLNVLVTSRVALRLQGEHEFPVPPLALPARYAPSGGALPAKQLLEAPAVALFVARGRAHRPDFALTEATAPVVTAICARLEGLPLALVLAAAWVKLLPPAQLLARMERTLPLLTGGARDLETRQQTMRNTLAWSEHLLSPEEQRLFQRLSVFVGGFTLEAAEAVCAAPTGAEPLGIGVLEGLERLVDHSLVQPWTVDGAGRDEPGAGEAERRDGEARFRLHYVVREYALERLEASGETQALRRAHAAYVLVLAEQADWQKLFERAGARRLARLEQEHDNCRGRPGLGT